MSVVSTFLDRNAAYAAHHHPSRPALPSLNTIVVSCLDAGIDPAHILGLAAGEALVVRNAIDDRTQSLEADLARLQASEHLPGGLTVSGLRYDEATGRADVEIGGAR